MLNDLEVYLNTSTTPELRDLILEATEVLLTAGVDNHLFLMRNALDEADASGDFDVVNGRLLGTLIPIYQQRLREFGIRVIDDAELLILVSLFKAVTAIENWDDRATLNALAAGDEDPESTFADIAEIVGDLPSSEYLLVLESVSPDLLDRIVELTNGPMSTDENQSESREVIRVRVINYLNNLKLGEESIFIQAMVAGLTLGGDFQKIIEPHLAALGELPPISFAQELVAFALTSSLSEEEILPTLNKLKESFQFSITQLMELDVEIRRLLGVQ